MLLRYIKGILKLAVSTIVYCSLAGSNRRPPRYKHVALPTELSEQDAEGGIRTHEAVAVELKSTPFDRSGTLSIFPRESNPGHWMKVFSFSFVT